MKKIILIAFTITYLFSKTITDQMSRVVEIPDKVNSIVVLQHQSLNALIQIGATNQIVGILQSWEKNLGSNYKKFMPNIDKLPTPGDLNSLNLESILSLKPDVVLVTNYMNKELIAKLEDVGIPVVMLSFFKGSKANKDTFNPEFYDEKRSYDDGFYEAIELLGEITNKQKNAKNLIDYVKKSQQELKEITSKIDMKNRVKIYMANPNFTTYGSGKYTSIIFSRAGGLNVAQKDIKGFKQITKEKLIKYNPDIIFVQNRYPFVVDELKSDKSLKTISAIKYNKIYLMPEYAKAWGYPTPEAMSLGEFWVAKILYPEEFKQFDLDKRVRQYYKKFYNIDF